MDEVKKVRASRSKGFETRLMDNYIRNLFRDGYITKEDLNEKDKIWKKLLSITKSNEWEITIDHTEDILTTAKMFSEKKDFDKAKLFYATYFEHQMNKLIVVHCTKLKIKKKIINEIIKGIPTIGKWTFLPFLLGIPEIMEKHRKVIINLSNDRNAYVHYKYNAMPEIEPLLKEKDSIEIKEILKSITYFKRYSSKLLFGEQKKHIEKFIKAYKVR